MADVALSRDANQRARDNGDSSFTKRVAGEQAVGIAAVIGNGASVSGVVDCDGRAISFIEFPAAWTTAALTMQHASDEAAFKDVYDSTGTEWSIASSVVATMVGKTMFFDPPLIGRKSIKLRSGTGGSPVNQGAARSFVVGLV